MSKPAGNIGLDAATTTHNMALELQQLVADVARCIKRVDTRRPQASNARTGVLYQPGIGPHPETRAVELITEELAALDRVSYHKRLTLGVPYPGESRQKCDLCVGQAIGWDWSVEVKMLRLMGDNGKPNDNMLMHILSPYPADHSALTDCVKLVRSQLAGQKAVVIYGFDYPGLSMDPAIEAFELLARAKVRLGERSESPFEDLVHPVHQRGRVFGWEVRDRLT